MLPITTLAERLESGEGRKGERGGWARRIGDKEGWVEERGFANDNNICKETGEGGKGGRGG